MSPLAQTRVCVVSQNCLAEAYLRKLLRGKNASQVLGIKQYVNLSPAQRKNTVFIVDQCGLEVPLCACLQRLREHALKAKFIVLDYEKSKDEIVRLLVMGADGYVPHGEVSHTLGRAIHCVAAGHLWVPYEALQEFLRQAAWALRKHAHGRETTTPREDQILELVRRRLSNREIAQLLKIRVSTVKFHLSNILSKMHARNRRELGKVPSADVWKGLLC